jgi:hypothetical protein
MMTQLQMMMILFGYGIMTRCFGLSNNELTELEYLDWVYGTPHIEHRDGGYISLVDFLNFKPEDLSATILVVSEKIIETCDDVDGKGTWCDHYQGVRCEVEICIYTDTTGG